MKLDMKAYDRVEWDFLESVMHTPGFSRDWVGLIMLCIRTICYSVLSSGSPSSPIKPERGLRQGDPLSPYLLLFCAYAFTSFLRRAK